VVKSKRVNNLVDDLDILFKCLKEKDIRLNPEKCVFGVPRGMLLGFTISKHGIEANPKKISTITKMSPIRDLKGIQKVTGCLAALSRFISRLGEKALPLYRLLKKSEHFSWTLKAEEALSKLKTMLSSPPISGHRGTPVALRCHDNTSGQHGRSCREIGRRACLTYSEAGLLHQ
jgi:hypothetical protein